MRTSTRHRLGLLGLLVAHFVACRVGLLWPEAPGALSAVWPASGVGLFGALTLGRGAVPVVWAATAAANATAGCPAAVSTLLGGVAAGEALLAAWLLRRRAGFRAALDRARDALLFVLLAGAFAPAPAAAAGAGCLHLAGLLPAGAFGTAFLTWWVGDALGVIVVAPFLLAWVAPGASFAGGGRPFEAAALLASLVVVGSLVFADRHGALDVSARRAFAVFPFLLWATVRFGLRGATAALLLVAAGALLATVHGAGPFVAASRRETLLTLQAFVLVAAAPTLPLAAALAERERAAAAVRAGESTLRALLDAIPDAKIRARRGLPVPAPSVPLPEGTDRAVESAIATGRVETIEYRADGPRHFEARVARIDGEEALVLVRDITAHARAVEALRESEERFRALADSAPVLIWLAGPDKLAEWFNRAWLEFRGRTLAQERGDGWLEGMHADDRARCLGVYTRAFDARAPFTMEYRLRRFLGEHRWVLAIGTPRVTPDGTFAGYVGTCVDIHERKLAEEALRRSEETFRQLAENIHDVFWMTGADGRETLYLSPVFESVWERPTHEAVCDWTRAFESAHPADRERVEAEYLTSVREGRGFDAEFRIVTPDGAARWIQARTYPVRDEAGAVCRIAGIARDVTRRKESEAELRAFAQTLEALATKDPLTGLWNRRGVEQALAREMARARRAGSTLMALMMDCDDFKSVNDALGHAVGDALLREIGRRAAAVLRPCDDLARVGGDEFLALLPDLRPGEAVQVAERMRRAIADRPLQVGARRIRTTACIGVAPVPEDAVSVEEVLVAVHRALARGKRDGKNRVCASGDPGGGAGAADPDAAAIDALTQGGCFRAFVQPIVDLAGGAVAGHEMLARGPEGPYEGPDDFFRLAMERNVLTVVDLRCFKTCVAAARRLAGVGRFHVNVFPSTLLDASTERLLALFEGADPTTFCVELSEQQFLGDPSNLESAVRRLKARGIAIAIDDVGFGRSSLESLVILEPQVVKVDRLLVRGAARNAPRRRRLERLLRVARSLPVEIVAEGVETEDDAQLLRTLGVRYAQGWLWGKPAPATEARVPASAV